MKRIILREVTLLGIVFLLIFIAFSLPKFGSYPSKTAISTYYLENTVEETGAVNTVSAVVWLYRGYDTLGESTVLFTAVVGLLLLARWKK